MRLLFTDTETTGTDLHDRIIEVGIVEMVDGVHTNRTFHRYLNPGVRVHPGAFAVHGLSDAFLADKPAFEEIADELLAFIAGGTLVIHNAPFDVGFLNRELAALYDPPPPIVLEDVIDTLAIARRQRPGKSNKLDALAAAYKVDVAGRAQFHGALIDARILAGVYRGLTAPKQADFAEMLAPAQDASGRAGDAEGGRRPRRFVSRLTDAERAAHGAFIAGLGADAVWRDYIGEDE